MPSVKSKTSNQTITRKVKDLTPNWSGCEAWSTDQYLKFFRTSMDWYRIEKTGKDLKHEVINWMSANDYSKSQIKAFKDTKDFRCTSTMGAIASNLNRGMQRVREDFNNGKDTGQWLRKEIGMVLESGKHDFEPVVESTEFKPVISIQERLKDSALAMTVEIEDAIESFSNDREAFNPKQFKVLNLLKGKQAKAAHARIIRDHYARQYAEYQEALNGKCDQLKEGYSHITKKNLKKIIEFYQEISSACEMLMQEAKVNKKPRTRKAVPAEKVVAKLKYCKTHEPLKLVSISPAEIIGAKELWVYNIKTRKLGKYIAEEYRELNVKGTTVINFSETNSVQKTLRKPDEQLKEFKNAGKVALRKFLDDIKAVDIKLNGRINEDTVLLKVQ